MPLLTPKFLVGTVGSDILIKSDEACRDLVDEAKNYLLLPQVTHLTTSLSPHLSTSHHPLPPGAAPDAGPPHPPQEAHQEGRGAVRRGRVVQWRRHSQCGEVGP